MSLRFPISLVGKRKPAGLPFATSLYDSSDNLLVSLEGDIPGSWNFFGSPYDPYRIEIGTSCTTIGAYAVSYNSNLTGSLNIPDSVTSIGEGAFFGNFFDGTLTISNSLTIIENSVFSSNGFTGTLVIPDSVTSIKAGAFQSNRFTGSLVIPDNVTSIEDNAFSYCSDFNGTLTISNNITTIPRQCFRNCSSFTGSLVIPGNVEYIMAYAFRNCTGFADLIIGNGLDRIGIFAFQGCAFTSVTLPSTITRLDQNCFYDNPNLTDFTFPASLTTIEQQVLGQCPNITNVNIYVTKTLFEANDGTFPQVNGQLATTGVTTVHVRASDNTWTAGTGKTVGGKTGITVIKDL